MVSKDKTGMEEEVVEGAAAFNSGVATSMRIHEVLRALDVCRANYPAVGVNSVVGRIFALYQELDCFMSPSQRKEIQPLMDNLAKILSKPVGSLAAQQVHSVAWSLEILLRRVAYEKELTMPKSDNPALAFRKGRG